MPYGPSRLLQCETVSAARDSAREVLEACGPGEINRETLDALLRDGDEYVSHAAVEMLKGHAANERALFQAVYAGDIFVVVCP